jgi:hypothetical protein
MSVEQKSIMRIYPLRLLAAVPIVLSVTGCGDQPVKKNEPASTPAWASSMGKDQYGAEKELLFFSKYDKYTAKVTKDDKFQEVLEISDGETYQRINLTVGQQFFLTAEFIWFERPKGPALIVYNEWGTGLQSLMFKYNTEKHWVQVFDHVAKCKVQFFFMTGNMKAAICDDGIGDKKTWHYTMKSVNDWTIDEDTDNKK